jgi:metal-responsive CopG/Arc/MetJ family transcriptional regulator
METINPDQVGIEAGFSFVVGKSERRSVRNLLSEMKVDGREFIYIEQSRWFGSDFHVLGKKYDIRKIERSIRALRIAYQARMTCGPMPDEWEY